MNRRLAVLACAVVIAASGAGNAAQPAAAPQPAPDPQTLGPKIGERVPDFSLSDQHGTTRTLRSTFGPKGVVLVFFRSADW